MPTHGTFDVEISLAKGIIFRKIGLANGAILKPWAAHPCPKFSREPPPCGLQVHMPCYSLEENEIAGKLFVIPVRKKLGHSREIPGIFLGLNPGFPGKFKSRGNE